MLTVYRLEDREGNGPFFYHNGVARFDHSICFDDEGLYAFTDQARFLEPSYIEFYQSDTFHLYEINVRDVLSLKRKEVVFDEKDVVSRREIAKVFKV